MQLKMDGAMVSLKLGTSLPIPIHLGREMELETKGELKIIICLSLFKVLEKSNFSLSQNNIK